MQGVTTDIVGNCGAGVAPAIAEGVHGLPGVELILGPLPESRPGPPSANTWTQSRPRNRRSTSAASCRTASFAPRHLGMDRRAPDADELAAMQADVDEGMAAGALGMSTGPDLPARHLRRHRRNRGAIAGGRAARRPLHEPHPQRGRSACWRPSTKRSPSAATPAPRPDIAPQGRGPEVWGKTTESIRMIEEARAAGTDVAFDAYPYTAGSTVLAAAQAVRRDIDPDAIVVASVNASARIRRQDAAPDRRDAWHRRPSRSNRSRAVRRADCRRHLPHDARGRRPPRPRPSAVHDRLRRHPDADGQAAPAALRHLPARARPLRPRSEALPAGGRRSAR